MLDYIFEIMKRMCIFLIIARMLVCFRPNPSYEKYFKFVTGIMTTVILIFPILEWKDKNLMDEYRTEIECFSEKVKHHFEIQEEQTEGLEVEPSEYRLCAEEKIKSKLNRMILDKGYIIESIEIKGIEGDLSFGKNAIVFVKILEKTPQAESKNIRVKSISVKENPKGDVLNLELMIADLLELDPELVEVKLLG